MIEDEEVLKVCRFWAKNLSTRHTSFNALVNEGYVVGKNLSNPKLLQKWVRWTMIHFLQREQLHQISTISSQDTNNLPSTLNNIPDTSFSFSDFKILQSDLLTVIDKVCSEKEKECDQYCKTSNIFI